MGLAKKLNNETRLYLVMKEAIENLVHRAFMTNAQFAKAIGMSTSLLHQYMRRKYIDMEKLTYWAMLVNVPYVKVKTKYGILKITFDFKNLK